MLSEKQKTLLKSIKIQGTGLHSGETAELTLKPSLPNTGIVFVRTDIEDGKKNLIKAIYKNVTSARLCTKITNSYGISVSTIEHLMGAIYGEGIDNILIEINNSEVPIMDGSAADFVKSIREAGTKVQNVSKNFIEVLRKVEIKNNEKYISIEPFKKDFKIDFELIYKNKLIGNQRERLSMREGNLESIYNSRTFCLYEDIEKIKSIGLAKGGTLQNAVVVQGDRILNNEGLRDKNEFVKHKILDCLGDFMLTGHRMFASVECVRGGHQLTNDLLKKFFSDNSNWKFVNYDSKNLETYKNYNFNSPIAVNA